MSLYIPYITGKHDKGMFGYLRRSKYYPFTQNIEVKNSSLYRASDAPRDPLYPFGVNY